MSQLSTCGWGPAEDSGEVVFNLTGRAGTGLYMAPEVTREEPYNEKVCGWCWWWRGCWCCRVPGPAAAVLTACGRNGSALHGALAGLRPARTGPSAHDGYRLCAPHSVGRWPPACRGGPSTTTTRHDCKGLLVGLPHARRQARSVARIVPRSIAARQLDPTPAVWVYAAVQVDVFSFGVVMYEVFCRRLLVHAYDRQVRREAGRMHACMHALSLAAPRRAPCHSCSARPQARASS